MNHDAELARAWDRECDRRDEGDGQLPDHNNEGRRHTVSPWTNSYPVHTRIDLRIADSVELGCGCRIWAEYDADDGPGVLPRMGRRERGPAAVATSLCATHAAAWELEDALRSIVEGAGSDWTSRRTHIESARALILKIDAGRR